MCQAQCQVQGIQTRHNPHPHQPYWSAKLKENTIRNVLISKATIEAHPGINMGNAREEAQINKRVSVHVCFHIPEREMVTKMKVVCKTLPKMPKPKGFLYCFIVK